MVTSLYERLGPQKTLETVNCISKFEVLMSRLQDQIWAKLHQKVSDMNFGKPK